MASIPTADLDAALAGTQQLILNVVPPGVEVGVTQSDGSDGHGVATAITVEDGRPLLDVIGQIASRGWRLVTVSHNEHLGPQYHYSRT